MESWKGPESWKIVLPFASGVMNIWRDDNRVFVNEDVRGSDSPNEIILSETHKIMASHLIQIFLTDEDLKVKLQMNYPAAIGISRYSCAYAPCQTGASTLKIANLFLWLNRNWCDVEPRQPESVWSIKSTRYASHCQDINTLTMLLRVKNGIFFDIDITTCKTTKKGNKGSFYHISSG